MKTVAVIGAGASGLTAIKSCLEEGLKPTCFERSDYIGGLWHYTETIEEDQSCVMKSTVTNTSKEMMCFSDFPMPDQYPMFMYCDKVERYLNLYSDAFDLKKYIQHQTEVINILQTKDYSQTGQWKVKVRQKVTGVVTDHVFDAVMICIGHHAQKRVPDFPGISEFQGKVIHTHEYKIVQDFAGKRVLVVGIGNSGGDVAVDAAHVASQVFISTRRGRWVVPRLVEKGYPIDMSTSTRFNIFMFNMLPGLGKSLATKRFNNKIDHKLYSLQPKHGFVAHQVTINDYLHNLLACGAIILKPKIKTFTRTGVIFDDETVENIDAVIMATGYNFNYPFIDDELLKADLSKVNLYKMIFPPGEERHTLSVIGCIQATGAVLPLSEIQARLVTKVIKGEVTLPSKDEMCKWLDNRKQTITETHAESENNSIQVHYIPYLDEIAEMHGSKPDLGKQRRKENTIVNNGVHQPYQFRLTGPGKWSGAKDAINSQWKRTFASLRTRETGVKQGTGLQGYLLQFKDIR
ncbi:hypothetical protein KUTeg_002870 [Tegillarca granosa]|uniref:Flavin-containing monooxygenase n=1 Tax=Tegillarca granosa TaxID=220873 RepID=A0ABQ9FS60_TEGGR|nr:hypothetical protein KUTeg_002870 [Tegillarca granosa]